MSVAFIFIELVVVLQPMPLLSLPEWSMWENLRRLWTKSGPAHAQDRIRAKQKSTTYAFLQRWQGLSETLMNKKHAQDWLEVKHQLQFLYHRYQHDGLQGDQNRCKQRRHACKLHCFFRSVLQANPDALLPSSSRFIAALCFWCNHSFPVAASSNLPPSVSDNRNCEDENFYNLVWLY